MYELRAKQLEVVFKICERPRCVCFTSNWKWEEPVLFCTAVDLQQAEKTSETKFTHHCCESACRPNEGPRHSAQTENARSHHTCDIDSKLILCA